MVRLLIMGKSWNEVRFLTRSLLSCEEVCSKPRNSHELIHFCLFLNEYSFSKNGLLFYLKNRNSHGLSFLATKFGLHFKYFQKCVWHFWEKGRNKRVVRLLIMGKSWNEVWFLTRWLFSCEEVSSKDKFFWEKCFFCSFSSKHTNKNKIDRVVY